MPGALPQRKAASEPRSIGQTNLKDVRKQDFCRRRLLQGSHQVGDNRRRFAWIDRAFASASSRDPVLVHHPSDPVLAHVQERCELAMSQGIILRVSVAQ